MTEMTLMWPRHQEAKLLEEAPKRGRSVATVLDMATPRTWVEVSGRVEHYDCLRVPALYKQVAQCPQTARGVLEFVRVFGFLRKRREAVDDICHEIQAMRSVVRLADRKDWAGLEAWLLQNQQSRAISLAATLHYERGHKGPTLLFQPRDLISAAYLQLYQDAAKGAQMRQCANPGCGEWFYYGPGTKPEKRETARYHSPACQKAHAYRRTKGAAQ